MDKNFGTLEGCLKKVFEEHGYLWFSMDMVNEADGQICKCYVVDTKRDEVKG